MENSRGKLLWKIYFTYFHRNSVCEGTVAKRISRQIRNVSVCPIELGSLSKSMIRAGGGGEGGQVSTLVLWL